MPSVFKHFLFLTAILVPPGDVPALVGAIVKLCENWEMASSLGANARACALDKYTWKANVKNILDAVERLI